MARNHTSYQKHCRNNATHCAYCGHKMYTTGKFRRTIDHFYPFSLGQEVNRGWNKFNVCRRCNQLKGKLTPEKYIEAIGKTLKTIAPDTEYAQDLRDSIVAIRDINEQIKEYFYLRDIL